MSTQAREDISYSAMRDLQAQVADQIRKNPAVVHVTSTVGGNSRNPLNNGSMFVELKPKEERAPLSQVLAELGQATSKVAGIRTYINPQQSLRLGGRSSASQYQLVIQGLNADATNEWSNKLMEAMRRDRTFAAVNSDAQNGAIAATISVDPEKAAAFGITNDQLRKTLEMSFGGYTAAQIQSTGDSYDVIVEFDSSKQWNDDFLSDINILSAKSGVLVPLSNFATLTRTQAPVTINQTGQLVSTTVSFNLPDGVALSDATSRIDQIKTTIGLPQDVFTSYGGTAAIFQQSQGNTSILILAAVLTIYVVLGVLYESFIHPLTILSGLRRRHWRAGGAEGDGHGFLDHCADRAVDADWHRQEKRDHDDRRCGGTDPRKGRTAHPRHPRSLRAPFPADHDDDLLRAAGRPAHRPRLRRQLGTAPATWCCRGRWSHRLAIADAVHHSGHLRGNGQVGYLPHRAVFAQEIGRKTRGTAKAGKS